MSGIPFIGEEGFHPDQANGSGRWEFQRTIVIVEGGERRRETLPIRYSL
jgi:hypothetical protein